MNLAREAKNRLIHDYIDQPKYSKACASLDDGFEDAFQYTVQGNSHNRLKSTNLIERLNQEVRRREKNYSYLSKLRFSQSFNWSSPY
ncbi:transposase (plasmid) [Enterococcus faecium]